MEKGSGAMALPDTKTADALAGTSVVLFASVSVAQLNEVVQLIGGVVAIGAGIAAIWYHVTKTRMLKRTGRVIEGDD
jgi:hypothetical protein